jgi:hypothetical protein
MSRLQGQLDALREAGATVHAVRFSTLSKSVLWDHADGCADFYVVLRYFTQTKLGEHVALAELQHHEHDELREYRVHAPTCVNSKSHVTPHLGVYVFNPSVCGEAINGPLALQVRSASGVLFAEIQPDTCPLVHTIADLRRTCTELSLHVLKDDCDVKLRVYAG